MPSGRPTRNQAARPATLAAYLRLGLTPPTAAVGPGRAMWPTTAVALGSGTPWSVPMLGWPSLQRYCGWAWRPATALTVAVGFAAASHERLTPVGVRAGLWSGVTGARSCSPSAWWPPRRRPIIRSPTPVCAVLLGALGGALASVQGRHPVH
jgi:hypothetical protein